MQEIKNPTVEQIDEMLKKIGWSVAGRYPNRWIRDHKGDRTNWRVMSDRIECEERNSPLVTCFYYQECMVDLLEDGDAVSISSIASPNACYVLFMNHSIKRNISDTNSN